MEERDFVNGELSVERKKFGTTTKPSIFYVNVTYVGMNLL